MGTDAALVVFRRGRVGLVGLVLVAVALAPVAFAVPGLPALYVLPVGCALWLLRASTAVGPDTVVARQALRTRRVAWHEVTSLRVDQHGRIRAVLAGRGELALPGVRARDLPAVAAASGGRIDDPYAAAGRSLG